MKLTVGGFGLHEALVEHRGRAATAITGAMREAAFETKMDWRQALLDQGISKRLTNTIRDKVYPSSGRSLDPAGLVHTKAPEIFASMAASIIIRPTGAKMLAIPTANVPHKTAQRLMTPVEVEASFNQDLIFLPGKQGRKLACVNVLQSKNRKGWRRPTKGRLAQGRTAKLVLMFVCVPSVKTRKRFDLDALANRGAARYAALAQKALDEI